jgi:hypothetical protein
MDILEFFQSAAAVKAVFTLGFLPTKEEFYELTPDQYEQYYANNEPTDEKIFMILPNDPQKYGEVASADVFVVTEREMHSFESVGRTIENYCKDSKKKLKTFDEKLHYVADKMPPFFSEGTKYEKFTEMKLK